MENIAEALKLAGFTLLFVIALSIAMITIMQGKRTSETIISYSDKTKYYSNIEENEERVEDGNRIVQIEDIIPTLYRYDQEQYIVLFNNIGGQPLKIFDGTINNKSRAYLSGANKNKIAYLNYNLEAKLEENWTKDHSTIKSHVDEVVKYLFNNYKDTKFIETIETTTDVYKNNVGINSSELVSSSSGSSQSENNQKEIRVITYIMKE